MEFRHIFTIYETALDIAILKGHQQIVELFSHSSTTEFINPEFTEQIENHIRSFFPNTEASIIKLITAKILAILGEQI